MVALEAATLLTDHRDTPHPVSRENRLRIVIALVMALDLKVEEAVATLALTRSERMELGEDLSDFLSHVEERWGESGG